MDATTNSEPQVTKAGLVDMQVCVPADWTDKQVEYFANHQNPTGIGSRWAIRRADNKFQAGAAERVDCSERAGCVHIMLEC